MTFALLLVGAEDASSGEPADVNLPFDFVSNTSASFAYEVSSQQASSASELVGELPRPIEFRASTAWLFPKAVRVDEGHFASQKELQFDPDGELPAPMAIDGRANLILPDSEVVDSPNSKDFDIAAFVAEKKGFLEIYQEQVAGVWMNGAEIVQRVAQNHSINPRLLLAVVEYQSGWVSQPARPNVEDFNYPIQTSERNYRGLYMQLSWTADTLSRGYYSYRNEALLVTNESRNTLNAGTSAFNELIEVMCSNSDCGLGLITAYRQLFGNPWESAVDLFVEDLDQPPLILPFPGTNEWMLTGGPHAAWGSESPWAALDFAPKWDPKRRTSNKEVVAVANGVIARADYGILVLDLDGDGYEQTGWSIFYLHVVAAEWISEGAVVHKGQIIGEASSVGGVADGDHIHIARKFNGEWISVVGPVPFTLSGWQARSGAQEYDGELYRETHNCIVVVSIGDFLPPAPSLECRSNIPN